MIRKGIKKVGRNFFQERLIKGTETRLLQEKLLDIKFASKEFHKN